MKKQQHLPNQPISTGLLILLFLFAFAALPAIVRAQIFVDTDATGNNDGTSWTDAYTTLQDALTTGFSGEIWVAEGVYFPDEGGLMIDNDRSATFQLFDGVEIYGGFDPGDNVDEFGERDWQAHPTILSGDIDGNDTTTDGVVTDTGDIDGGNSYNVVTGFGTGGTILLDGFIITAGLADDSANNSGGGMFNTDNSTVLTNVIFSGNSASFFGGGMYNLDSSPVLTNVTFSDNSAELGGGMFNDNSSSALTNVTLSNNSASVRGGGIYNDTSSSTLTNTILWGNTADFGGNEMYNESDGSATLNYSLYKNDEGDIVEGGGFTATNSLTADPLFVDPVNGDYSLQDTSPAINTGDPDTDLSLFPGGPGNPLDLAANPRLDAFIIDMGAYEVQGAPARFIPDENNILYVDKNVSGGNQTGDSWANGISELRDALDWAGNEWDGSNPPLQIWVADGIYTPTGDDTDRSATFRLVNNVEVYGGFDGGGGEENLTDRNIDAHPTILSGDIDGNDTTTDGVVTDTDDISDNNSFHVVTGDGTGGTALLDGFTVTAGLADEGGGGMINASSSHPTLANVIFSGNSASIFGGGMYNLLDSNPTLTNVTFSGNSVGFNGGGIYNESSSNPTLTNVIFTGNSADNDGGGIYNASISNPTLTNVIFSGNSAGESGGGLFNFNSNPSLTNVIIWDNEAGGVTTSMSSSIFNSGSNPDISHSLIANSGGSGTDWEDAIGNDGDNNIDTDPLFVDPTDPDGADDTFGTDDDGLQLANASPAINEGDNSAVPSGVTTDLAGNDRIRYTTVDMGAYEWEWNGGATVFVDKNATGSNTGESWEDAFTDLQDALPIAPDIDEVWVANGVYTPTDNTDERDATFQLSSGLAVYGGFAGGEPNREDRDWGANPTILSGDIGGDDTSINGVVTDPDNISGNNSYQVVTGSGTNNTAILDGFTITAGNADGSSPKDLGGGMYNNDGSPTLFNISIIGNSAAFGGGIFNENSSPDLVNFLITGNSSGTDGGAMVNFANSHSVLTNGTFTGNRADDEGGAIYNEGSDPTLTNVIIWDNQANGSTTSGAASISNVISTPAISHSLIANSGGSGTNWEGAIGDDNGNNIDADPLFVDPTDPDGADDLFGTSDDGLALQDTSPAINTGDPDTDLSLFPGGPDGPLDLAGNPRVFEGIADPDIIDMGAYEFQGNPFATPGTGNILYVDKNVSGGDESGNSWANAIPELRDALDWAANEWDGSDPPLQIWVADGLYLPTGDDSDRDATFQLVNNVEIYGGFDGGESTLGARDVDANSTILSGDIGEDDEPFNPSEDTDNDTDTPSQTDHIVGGNSYSVVIAGSGVNDTAVLNGFTITSGNADTASSPVSRQRGGGMHNEGNPILSNLMFIGNNALNGGGMHTISDIDLTDITFRANSASGTSGTGGGMSVFSSNPVLTNVSFDNNYAPVGGGLRNLNSSPVLINVSFIGNKAETRGGGMFNRFTVSKSTSDAANSSASASAPELINVVFVENTAATGGGLYNENGTPVLVNVTFHGNDALTGEGGGMANTDASAAEITNTIFWENTAAGSGNEIFNDGSSSATLSFSLYRDRDGESDIVEGGGFDDGDNSLTDDPLFVDPTDPDGTDDLFGTTDDGLALQNTSPAINAGDPSTDLSLFPGGPGDPLDLAGNPRVFDGAPDPDIIDMGAYEFQGEPDSGPEGEDRRILVSNQGPHAFSGGDFGVSNAGFSIKIETLPGKGDMKLDGSDADVDDMITIAEVNAGELIWDPQTDDHGYNYTSFEFTIVDEGGLESEQAFTLTIDLAAGAVELNGSEGWRFLTSPSTGDTYGDLLSPISVDLPPAGFPTLYELDQADYEWDAVADLDESLQRGLGFIVLVDGADLDATLTSGESWEPLEDEFSYSGLEFDPSEPNPDNFFLIANPHPISVDFCEFTRTEVATSVYFWDPDVGGGNGDYVSLNCAAEDVFIAPFQAFWIRTTNETADSPALVIPESAYLESAEGGFFKKPDDERSAMSQKDIADLGDGFLLSLSVTGEEGVFTNTADILFSDEGRAGLDPIDTPKLSPAGLAERWLSFYSLGEDGRAYAFQSLPTEALAQEGLPESEGQKLRIPLDLETTEAGWFTLDWTLPEQHHFNGSYFLRDNETGDVMELREGGSYSFEVESTQPWKGSEPFQGLAEERSAKSPKDFADLGEADPRFELLIAAEGIDGLTELGDVPDQFELGQNYPNPFNPVTVISYQLPVSSQVRLDVYDMLGRQVATLVEGQVAAGRHTVNFDAGNLSSGVYLYRLQAGSQIMTRKLTVVK